MSTPATNVNRAALVALASLAVMAQASPARAGAFNMAEGEGQIIVASSFSGANQSFDLDGKLRSTNRFSKFETTALLQYGFTDWLTLIAKPSFVATSLGGAPGVYSAIGNGAIETRSSSMFIVNDADVFLVDTNITPEATRRLVNDIRTVTDKPIKYVVLTHYHAVRVLGASGYEPQHIICSEATREMIVERGAQDYKSELQRFPRLFQAAETIPGLTWPTITFKDRMSIWLGKVQVDIIHAGRGHTKGDTIVWLPEERVLFSGDLVEYGATPYCGDAHYKDWPATLQKLRDLHPEALVPGRGDALVGEQAVEEGIAGTQAFLSDLYKAVSANATGGQSLKEAYDKAMAALQPRYGNWVIFEHCMPFNVSRAYDEAKGLDHPRIWTAERDIEMWGALEKSA